MLVLEFMTRRELVQAEDMGSNSQYSEGLELAQNDKRQTGRLEITPDTVDHVLWIYHVCQLLHMCLRRLLYDYTQGSSHSGVECAKLWRWPAHSLFRQTSESGPLSARAR